MALLLDRKWGHTEDAIESRVLTGLSSNKQEEK